MKTLRRLRLMEAAPKMSEANLVASQTPWTASAASKKEASVGAKVTRVLSVSRGARESRVGIKAPQTQGPSPLMKI